MPLVIKQQESEIFTVKFDNTLMQQGLDCKTNIFFVKQVTNYTTILKQPYLS